MSGRRNRINKRSEKKEQDQRIRDSLADSSTPAVPALEDTTPQDVIQDSTLPPVQEENIVTAAAASTIQDKGYSSETSGDSETSGISKRKIYITTAKKSQSTKERNSPITESIPFNTNMTAFDTELTYLVEVWLGAVSASAEIKLMFVDNEILTYDDYKQLDKESIYLLDCVKSNGATIRLKHHHAKRVNDALEWLNFLEESGKITQAADPMKWVKQDFERWKRKGHPSGSTATTSTPVTNNNPTSNLTSAAEKQLKADENKLQSWIKGTKSAKDYPVIEHDEYYTEWIVKMNRQITLDMWERLVDPTFDSKTLRKGADKDLYTLQCVFMSTVL